MTYNSKLNLGTWIFNMFWRHKTRYTKIWYYFQIYTVYRFYQIHDIKINLNKIEYVFHFHQSFLVQLRDLYCTRTSYFYKKLIGFEYNNRKKKISELIVIVHHLVHYTCICAIICPNILFLLFLFPLTPSAPLLLVL